MQLLQSVDERLRLGVRRYGHGVRVRAPKHSWMEMCREELLDAFIYIIADYIRYKGIISNGRDDNELIRSVANNWSEIDSSQHRMLLWNLIRMLDNELFCDVHRNVCQGNHD